MFCINCGTSLPDEAIFCIKCGKPQKPGVQEAEKTEWITETCEINYKITHDGLTGTRGYFCADAIGTSGLFMAGRSLEFGCGYNTWLPESNNASHYKTLVENLVKDSWESTGERGEHWWNSRFRRKVKVADKSLDGQNFVNLVMVNAGSKKIEVIKVIRQLTKLELIDAKRLTETPNAVILRNVSRSSAVQAQSLFQALGATVKIV